ncbi:MULTISPECIES: ornithine cyclodeaminase family protein [Actinomycetes]|uniref:Ornithine cyclodeaminase n=2 Tax=Actinomycetes TaxID=1760 RepID=A0ABP6LXK3_9MICC
MLQTLKDLPLISAEEVRRQITPDRARELIEGALVDGYDPAGDPARQHVEAGSGHLLLMPSAVGRWVGVKVASVAPDNPRQGLPRIQAVYVLMDAETLTPRALVDGAGLTSLRTPATTAVACDRLADPEASHLVVFGSGPQAMEHVEAVARIRQIRSVKLIGRNEGRARVALDQLSERGHRATAGRPKDVAEADIVVCATSSADPVVENSWIRAGAFVAAVGSHQPTRRELPGQLLSRSLVTVEDRETAFREAGDIVLAHCEGLLPREGENLWDLAAVVRGEVTRRQDCPNIFKGTGMSWQDLAVVAGLDLEARR